MYIIMLHLKRCDQVQCGGIYAAEIPKRECTCRLAVHVHYFG